MPVHAHRLSTDYAVLQLRDGCQPEMPDDGKINQEISKKPKIYTMMGLCYDIMNLSYGPLSTIIYCVIF
jgi:hypothetical protein